MAKEKSIYTCTECGGTSPRWQGKCPHCDAWNTLVESVAEGAVKSRFIAASRGLMPAESVATLSEIEAADAEHQPTGIDELDRALVVKREPVRQHLAVPRQELVGVHVLLAHGSSLARSE